MATNQDTNLSKPHETYIDTGGGYHYVRCVECGQVGVRQLERADAEAIAARHTEVAGFDGPLAAGLRADGQWDPISHPRTGGRS